MASNSIIPDFMSENPNDIFQILMPLKLKIDHESYSNSHYVVAVKNITKNEVFTYEMAPELLFQYFPPGKYFKNGLKTKYKNDVCNKKHSFNIDASKMIGDNIKITSFLSEKNIVSLIGWKRKYLNEANNLYCYYIEQDNQRIIIPQYAVALYYYFRFSRMREVAFSCKLDDLFVGADCDANNNASIVLDYFANDVDAAFIHRFACQEKAKKAFDDIGLYINSYLKTMKEKYNKDNIDLMPIKAKFPVADKFTIHARVSMVYNEDTKKEYHFVHEIIDDNSNIGFIKFTKYFQKNKIIQDISDIDNIGIIKSEIPTHTSQILKVKNATKKYTQRYITKDKKLKCSSLDNVDISQEEITKDVLIDIMKIYEKAQSDEVVDQSLTESSISGEKTIRKIIISSSYIKQDSGKEYIHNFEIFNQYIYFLKYQSSISNLNLHQVQKLPEIINKKTKRINQKGLVQGRARHYITATFKFKESYVGLLEIENATNATASTWVIVSVKPVNKHTFDKFINHYLGDNLTIQKMKNDYKSNLLKFTTKNHERTKDLKESDKRNWFAGLIGKIF
ncbi:MAG: hypothetical protein JXQ77_02280 [Campylobacterales bacterium]|nr:hypothetical protein [Campylobacterales bacterium]